MKFTPDFFKDVKLSPPIMTNPVLTTKEYFSSLSSGMNPFNIIQLYRGEVNEGTSLLESEEHIDQKYFNVLMKSNFDLPTCRWLATSRIDEIIITFYDRNNKEGIKLYYADTLQLNYLNFQGHKPNYFLIHATNRTSKCDFSARIKDKLLASADSNLFILDWDGLLAPSYICGKNVTALVGQTLALFMYELSLNFNVSISENAVLIGYSLGAHIAGIAGYILGGKVSTIIALDPAGPGYDISQQKERLSKGDALYIQVIHTNAGNLGYSGPCGDADFWVNGGKFQPECEGKESFGTCSHQRAFKVYAESLDTNGIEAHQCKSWEDYESEKCAGNVVAKMGGIDIDRNARGNFYLSTKKKK